MIKSEGEYNKLHNATKYLYLVLLNFLFIKNPEQNITVYSTHHLILKDGAVPGIKDAGHDSEPQAVCKTASNLCVLLAIGTHMLVTL